MLLSIQIAALGLSPSSAEAMVTYDLPEAKKMAGKSKIKVNNPQMTSFSVSTGKLSLNFEILAGDHSTVKVHNKSFSFDESLSTDENIINFAKFLKENFGENLEPQEITPTFWSQFSDYLIPKAHAGGLGIALALLAVAAVVFFVVKIGKDKKEEKNANNNNNKDAEYSTKIHEQIQKGNNFKQKNWAYLQDNTKKYQGRSNPDGHDCYIMSRAYHDHMKYFEKGYEPNLSNYTNGCGQWI